MLGKKFRLLQGFLEKLLALLFVHITIHLAQHGISHSLQCGVLHLQHLGFHPLHVRCQRVGRNLFPENHLPHFSSQQLAVVFSRRSLGDDFLHHPNLAPRLILPSDDVSLLPQVVVCLCRSLRQGKNGYNEC